MTSLLYVAARAHSRNPDSCKAAVNSLDIKPALGQIWIKWAFPLLCFTICITTFFTRKYLPYFQLFLYCNEDSNIIFSWPSKKVRGEKGVRVFTVSLGFGWGRYTVTLYSRQPESSESEPRSSPSCPTRFKPFRSQEPGSVLVSVFPLHPGFLAVQTRGGWGRQGEHHRGNQVAPSAREAADRVRCAASLLHAQHWCDGFRRPGNRESAGKAG